MGHRGGWSWYHGQVPAGMATIRDVGAVVTLEGPVAAPGAAKLDKLSWGSWRARRARHSGVSNPGYFEQAHVGVRRDAEEARLDQPS